MLTMVVVGCDSSDPERPDDVLRRADLWTARTDPPRLTAHGTGATSPATTTRLCCEPSAVAAAEDSVWVSTARGHVLRFDDRGDVLEASLDVGGRPGRMAATDGDLWVVEPETNAVLHVDTTGDEVVARIPLGSADGPVVDVATVGADVWALLDFSMTLVRIDPETNAVAERVAVCPEASCRVGGLAAAGGRLYVVESRSGRLWVLDGAVTRPVTDLGPGTWSIAARDDRVFALDRRSGRLVALDAVAPAEPVASRSVAEPRGVAVGAESVWVYEQGERRMLRLGVRNLEEVDVVPVDSVVAFAAR